MSDVVYDAWLAERRWRRGRESCNAGRWQVYADTGMGDAGDMDSWSNGDTEVAGYGRTLVEARANARHLIEEREALREPAP